MLSLLRNSFFQDTTTSFYIPKTPKNMKTITSIFRAYLNSWRTMMVMAAVMMLSVSAIAQTDSTSAPQGGNGAPPRERPMRPGGHGGPNGDRSRGFKPKLQGVWQLCSLQKSEDGQPQMNMLPVLRVYYGDEFYQTVAIPSEGGCFVMDQSTIEKTSDSTYTATTVKMHPDSIPNTPVNVTYHMFGPLWLSLKFQKAGETQENVEFWIRVLQNDARADKQQEQVDGAAFHPGQGRPQGRPGQGGKGGKRNNVRGQLQKNPFDQSSQSSSSISEADD